VEVECCLGERDTVRGAGDLEVSRGSLEDNENKLVYRGVVEENQSMATCYC